MFRLVEVEEEEDSIANEKGSKTTKKKLIERWFEREQGQQTMGKQLKRSKKTIWAQRMLKSYAVTDMQLIRPRKSLKRDISLTTEMQKLAK